MKAYRWPRVCPRLMGSHVPSAQVPEAVRRPGRPPLPLVAVTKPPSWPPAPKALSARGQDAFLQQFGRPACPPRRPVEERGASAGCGALRQLRAAGAAEERLLLRRRAAAA